MHLYLRDPDFAGCAFGPGALTAGGAVFSPDAAGPRWPLG
jgi:hypothetical protein